MPIVPESTNRAVDFVFDRLADVGFEKLNLVQQQLVCVWGACGEVGNGGFWQFFFNTSGDRALSTPESFEAFEAPEFAAIFRVALSEFKDGAPSTDLDERRQEIESLPDSAFGAWDDLSGKIDTFAMDDRINDFIRANEAAIYSTHT